MLKKIRTLVLRIVISLLSLGVFFYSIRGEIGDGWSHLAGLKFWPVFGAVILTFISLLVVTFRLRTILVIQHVRLSFWRLYYLWAVSLFFNLFLPSAVGGDIAKAYYIARDSGKKMASVTSVLLDRLFGMMATISIGFIAFLLGREEIDDPKVGQLLFWVAGLAMLGTLFLVSRHFSRPAQKLILFVIPKRFHERVQKFFDALELYRGHWPSFFLSLLSSVIAQVLFILTVYFLAVAIHIHLPMTVFFLFMPLVTVASMIPSIGGLGVREAAMVYLFRGFVSTHEAVALSFIFDLFLYGIGFVCGILYAIRGGASIRELERIEAAS